VLDELASRGLLDEQRAADAVVTAQSRRFGQRRLQQSLRTRGLGADEAAAALARVEGSELERARAIWQRRFGLPATDAAERARQARFLAGRGFAGDVIRRVVQGLDDTTDQATTDATDDD
jgi:regulatory protein